MNPWDVDTVARAILYEGYLLYPYRPSALKNRQRWTFGGLNPQGTEPCAMQAACLVQPGPNAVLHLRVRFLHPLTRQPGVLAAPLACWPDTEPEFQPVPELRVDDRTYSAWQEASEREVCLGVPLAELPRLVCFTIPASRHVEGVRDRAGAYVGVLVRQTRTLAGEIAVTCEHVQEGVLRLVVRISNETAVTQEMALHAFVATHAILRLSDGAFVSLTDPPDDCRMAAEQCQNVGCWPVLAGFPGSQDTMLVAPIILYDYPQIAAQSPNDLFDATEIDEILTLRILTLTEEEKRQMAEDERSRVLLERTEELTPEQRLEMHGTMSGRQGLRIGGLVRLNPGPAGDIFDLALAGMTAVIESIEEDREGRIHVSVTVLDDPGRDLGVAGKPGHRFYFRPEELEPLAE